MGEALRVSPSEAVFGFMSWLTSRTQLAGPFSAISGGDQAFELCEEFCAAQKWEAPRDGWDFRILYPSEKPTGFPPPDQPEPAPRRRAAPAPQQGVNPFQQRVATWVAEHWRVQGLGDQQIGMGLVSSAIRPCRTCGSPNWLLGPAPMNMVDAVGQLVQIAMLGCAVCGEVRLFSVSVMAQKGAFDGLTGLVVNPPPPAEENGKG